MSNLIDLEKQVLGLPPKERERLVLAAWASLDGAMTTQGFNLDPEGVEIALRRNHEIGCGADQPISHGEFLQRTNGGE